MALYYVVPRKQQLDISNHGAYYDRADAVANAEKLHARTGNHFHVVEVGVVHTTTTLADLMAEMADTKMAV